MKTAVEYTVENIHFFQGKPEVYPQEVKKDSKPFSFELLINSLSTAFSPVIVD